MKNFEPIDVAAWESFLLGGPSSLRNELGLSVERRRGAVALFADGVDSMLLNRVLGVDLLSEDQLRGLLAEYERRGTRRLFAQAPEERLSAGSIQTLQSAGLVQYHRRWVELVRRPGPVRQAETDLRVGEACAEHAESFSEILSSGFDMPSSARPLWEGILGGRVGWHCFVALDGDRVAAGGALFVEEQRACLVAAATAPSYRGRGAQQALMTHRLARAFELGCQTVYSETGEAVPGEPNPSYRNLIRHGFEPVGVRVNFVRPGTRW
mgnify:FL=1